MEKVFCATAVLSLTMLLASCGTTSRSTTPSDNALIAVKVGLGQVGALGLPTGGFNTSVNHLKVKVYKADGTLVTFKTGNSGVYEPGGNGQPFLTLNTGNTYATTVLLPKGDYQFESALKDGTDEGTSNDKLLGYSRSASTPVDAEHRQVRLSINAVMDPSALSLDSNTPITNVYTNDKLDLRLHVRTVTTNAGTFAVPTTDFQIGRYTVTHGDLISGTASQLGAKVLATGTAPDASVTVEVPVTALVRDAGTEKASLQTVNVQFSSPVVTTGMVLDVVEPTASITTTTSYQGQITNVAGEAADDRGVSRVRLYDGTSLIASSDLEDGVAALSLTESGWTAGVTFEELGTHDLTLIVNDMSGNETRVEQPLEVTAPPQDAWILRTSSSSSFAYYRDISVRPGETLKFNSPADCDRNDITWAMKWLANPEGVPLTVRQFDKLGGEIPEMLSYSWGPIGFYWGNVSWWNMDTVRIARWEVTNGGSVAQSFRVIDECAW